MTQNEVNFYAMLEHSNEAAYKMQDLIHENFNVNSKYDDETNTFTILGENTLQKIQAKNFIEEQQGDILFDIVVE